MCLSWNILISPSILKDNFAWHSILCSHPFTFRAGNILSLILRTLGAVERSEVILIFLPLCVSCHFSHTTFRIASLICIFDILIMCLTEIFLWWYLCRVLNVSSICMSTSFSRFGEGFCSNFIEWSVYSFFPNVLFLLIIWEFSTLHPNHTQFPLLPGIPPPCVSLQKQNKTNTLNPICVGSWSKYQWPVP